MELDSLIKIFGTAGVTFYVMWLWLASIRKDKDDVVNQLKDEQNARVKELREMLPLLNEASKSLQETLKVNEQRNDEVINILINHIDKRIDDVLSKCNKKT